MNTFSWNDILGWNQEQLEDMRLLGFAYVRQGKYSIALSIFEALSFLITDNTYELQTLGGLYLELGNPMKALDIIEQALEKEPYDEMTLLNRTKALLALGFKRQAIAQAKGLEKAENPQIALQAKALVSAYT